MLLFSGVRCSSAPAEELGRPLGVEVYSEALRAELAAAWESRPPAYKPRTHHLLNDGSPRFTNRLFLESSPYLLQHAHNPVDWHPWGDEAFALANKLKRPVLLSVGYSTCHWCHVMEEESFEDEEIARYLNENYIAIKVDREERPDVDAVYMAAVQAISGRGGWPMTVWLTPDREPYYGGTYFPPRDGDRGVGAGFLTLLKKLDEVYKTRGDEVAQNAAVLIEQIRASLAPPPGGDLPGVDALNAAKDLYVSRFDAVNGGLQGAPKFPSSLPIRFLLRRWRATGDDNLLQIASLTAEKMARGGMYDQVGGGFHRYSTDAEWLVPHFEKMLYDNALLVGAYLELYQATGLEEFARTARETLRWIEREMTSPEGGFYSAADADSLNLEGEREEGFFFTWTPEEIRKSLGEDAAEVEELYGVSEQGNFEGRTILFRRSEMGASEAAREKLYSMRAERPPPLRDDKVLAAWNGLAISAHALASFVLDEPQYLESANRAADFILANMRREGRLLRSHRNGQARHEAYLDDYAFLIAGLIDLYEVSGNPKRMRQAIELDQVLASNYEDADGGGFFLTGPSNETLLAREKPTYDGAVPTGNSVQALNLLRLYEFTTDESYRERAEKLFGAFSQVLKQSPSALSEMLTALELQLDETRQILIVTPGDRDEAEPFVRALAARFEPNRILAVVSEGEIERHIGLVPLLEGKLALGGKTTAYVCKQRVCKLPATDVETFLDQL